MPRRKIVDKREILPDPKFNSVMIAKFVNSLMESGKKSVAEGIFYKMLEIVEERTKQDPVKIFKKAVENTKPLLEVKSRRVGGATYQVPVEVAQDRRLALSYRWLITYSRGRAEKSMADKLANEIIDAANNRGASIKKREDTHKMAEANKAFAHYRW
jgi:small subunit ribosomal protein S7